MRYKFKAIKNTGERYEGLTESESKFTLFTELKAEGSTLLSAEEVKVVTWQKSLSKIFSFLDDVSMVQKISFAKNLSGMLRAGLPLTRALTVIERQSKEGKFKTIVENINAEIKKGKTLSDALGLYPNTFTRLFISMTKAGEESGALVDALNNIAIQMDKVYRLQKKVKGALIYPGVILGVMVTVGILMFIFVVPGITSTFKELGTELPFSTQLIIWVSDFMSNHWLVAVVLILGFIFGLYYSMKTVPGQRVRDNIITRLPLIGDLIKEANAARVTRTLSSLLVAGVPVSESLNITKDIVGNYLYRKPIEEALKVVEKGESMSEIFMKNSKYYPPFVGEMMAVGEETGNMAHMLGEVAVFYETDVEERTKDLSTIIEPVLMVIIGAAVGFFALSMITPIYSVMDKI